MKFNRFFLTLASLAVFLLIGVQVQAQSGASLHGTVILPTGVPVAGATVTVEGKSGGQAATSNQAGQYTIENLPAGEYTVTVSRPGLLAFEVKVSIERGASQEVDAVLTEAPRAPEPMPAAENPASPQQPVETSAPAAAAPQQTIAAENISVKVEKGKAAIYGVATDQSNAVIQGATATVTGPSGKVTVNVNTLGQYVINGLTPGAYKLTVSAPNFADFQTDITVAVDQGIQLDAQLVPKGNVTEVEVKTGGAAEVKTENAQVEGTITQKEVVQTGLNGRNFTQLIALAPGVSNQTGQDEALVGVKGSVKYSVNGGRVEYNNFNVDGSDVLNAGLNGAESTLMVYPSLDAIQEVKVLTSNYGAQYGRSASGTVLVSTKSGTKSLHGGAYDFVRNEFFNARNYFDQTTKAPLYRRQDFGGTLGGPLWIPGVFNKNKDRTYFFWSEEFRLEKSPQDFNQAVPTLAERGIGSTINCGAGDICPDFSDVCPPAGVTGTAAQYPDCPGVAVGGAGTRSLNHLSPVGKQILASGVIPAPNSAFGCNSSLAGTTNIVTNTPNLPCYATVISPATYWREELGRFDQNFTSDGRHRMSFRYIHDSWDTTEPTPLWGYVNNSFPTVQNRLIGPGTSLVVNLTNTLSPTLLNEFVASYANAHITLKTVPGPGASLSPIPQCTSALTGTCMSYIFNNGFGGKPPGVVIAGTNAAYGGTGFIVDSAYAPWDHNNPTISLSDNVTKGFGKHTFQFGIQAVIANRRENNGAIGSATGDLQGLLTFSNQNSLNTSGNAFFDMLNETDQSTSAIKSFEQDSAQRVYYNPYKIIEPYVQDDWKVNRRLTVNLGVRFSLFWNYHEKNKNAWNWVASQYDPAKVEGLTLAPQTPFNNPIGGGFFTDLHGNPITYNFNPADPVGSLPAFLQNGLVHCGVTPGVPDTCTKEHIFNPAPRIGIAFDPKGDGKTSIRAGYGLFYEHGTPKEANTGSLEGNAPLVVTMTDPQPPGYPFIGQVNGTSVAYPIDVTSIPTKITWPYVQQWSLSVQRQLPKDMVASVAYVGSRGVHLSAELQLNQLPVPPVGADNGIFANGNPFNPGQPITTLDCRYSAGSVTHSNPLGFGNFIGAQGTGINGVVVTPAEPAWSNLVASCYGALNPISDSPYIDIPDPNLLRPYVGFRRIFGLQNVADSTYHALQATIRRTRGPLTVGASYTYSHSFDDSSDRSDASFVNSADIHSNWASSSFDQRHLLTVNYVYDFPKMSRAFHGWFGSDGQDHTSEDEPRPAAAPSRFFRILFDEWQLSGITLYQSGTPFSVINSGSNLGIGLYDNAGVANGAGVGSYPDLVGNPKSALPATVPRTNAQSLGPILYNPAAFAAPQGLTFGNAGRNVLNNPSRLNFDMSLFKSFSVSEGKKLEFRAEAFNIFNHTQFRIFNPNLGNSANNTISCYGGGVDSPITAAGGLTQFFTRGTNGGATLVQQQVNCSTGNAFLHPIDAHRPRTIQLGLKFSF